MLALDVGSSSVRAQRFDERTEPLDELKQERYDGPDPDEIVELGELLVRRTAYARETLAAVPGVELLHDAPVAREFALRLDAPVAEVVDRVSEEGIAAGYPLGREYPEFEDGLLVAITERRSKGDIDRLADALARAIGAFVPDSGNKAPATQEVEA